MAANGPAIVYFLPLAALFQRRATLESVAVAAGLGAAATFPVLVIAYASNELLRPGLGPLAMAFHTALQAGIAEEGAKLLMLWLVVFRMDNENEGPGAVVLGVSTGLGFAALENAEYLFAATDDPGILAFLRATTAVPGHAILGVVMGAALAIFAATRRRRWAVIAFAAPALLHTLYDLPVALFALEVTDGSTVPTVELDLGFLLASAILLEIYLAVLFCRRLNGLPISPDRTDITPDMAWGDWLRHRTVLWYLVGGGFFLLGFALLVGGVTGVDLPVAKIGATDRSFVAAAGLYPLAIGVLALRLWLRSPKARI